MRRARFHLRWVCGRRSRPCSFVYVSPIPVLEVWHRCRGDLGVSMRGEA